jgi:hypothetical protein
MDLCSEERPTECNYRAICNCLQEGKLGLHAVLKFKEFLWGEENTVSLTGLRRASQRAGL